MIYPFRVYRHFKGNLYFVLCTTLSTDTLEPYVTYMSLTDGKTWSRSMYEFESEVPSDKENPTQQKHRFELVENLGDSLSAFSTQQLIEELRERSDSPLADLDVEGLNTYVKIREYVVGEIRTGCLFPLMTADTEEQARAFMQNNPHRMSGRTKLYKNVTVQVDFDEETDS